MVIKVRQNMAEQNIIRYNRLKVSYYELFKIIFKIATVSLNFTLFYYS